jgi:ATP-dependent Lon protease
MKESARAAVSYARSQAKRLGIDEDFYQKFDIHIHVPAGATPKDGPSAGIAMAVALCSALTSRPVRRDAAMTGEITLRGRILPIGGLKEKALAALRAGITTVIIPKKNEEDLSEIPKNLRRKLKFVLAKAMPEVLPLAIPGLSLFPVEGAEPSIDKEKLLIPAARKTEAGVRLPL